MKILRDNKGCDCVVGWFKNPEREAFVKYSHAIYQDKPQTALARADNRKLQNDMTLDDLLSPPELKLLIKDSYSYGAFLDDKIVRHHPAVIMDVQRHIAGHEVYDDITLVVIKQL